MIYVIHLEETDGDVAVEGFPFMENVKAYILKHKLEPEDYVLICGDRVPNLNPKDLKLYEKSYPQIETDDCPVV